MRPIQNFTLYFLCPKFSELLYLSAVFCILIYFHVSFIDAYKWTLKKTILHGFWYENKYSTFKKISEMFQSMWG